MPSFATRSDLETRFPRELVVLAADEVTREVDWDRVDQALSAADAEIRSVLYARYVEADFARATPTTLGILKLYAIDITLHRRPISSARTSDAIAEGYATAIARLQDIARGRGGLELLPSGEGGTSLSGGDVTATNPNQPMIDAPERQFTRARLGGM